MRSRIFLLTLPHYISQLNNGTVTMLLNWQGSRYRAPKFLELFIDNALKTMSNVVSDRIRNTRLEYWLLDPEGQVFTFFFTIMLAALIWLVVLENASSHHIEAAAARTASNEYDGALEELSDADFSSMISRLAPPGHRPVNAHLDVSPYRVVNHFAALTSFSTPAMPLQRPATPSELSAQPKSDEEGSTYC
ncbi:hypothetical protein BDU57DRAFT_494945 [Ampelomyces quisqualis]|uniref:Uncharacterized protein n=1 Tax=Ampelomyces quisqualis TaxID=50730 RepID=A0A6A5QTX3_AMPQU|nr:hypothetical protein BDU57DRAFT_494945 [Ampelomyces quisqualis]